METQLGTLADLAEILGALFVVGGVAFAVIQIRQFRRQRLEAASIELLRSFQSAEFTRAYTFLLSLPDRMPATELRERGAEAETLAMVVSTTIESIGVMVFRRIVPMEVVDDLMGGAIVTLWTKVESWVETLREEQGRDDTHEWFQWLAEQLGRRQRKARAQPAYLQHRDWRA